MPDPIDIEIIVAARRRGISLRVLASQLGCSPQAVSARVKNFERRSGQKISIQALPPHRGRVASICERCGRTKWWCAPHMVQRFCSRRCYHDSSRRLSHEELLRAIEARQSGCTWTHVGKLFDMDVQPIQGRIYRYLRDAGLLTRSNLNRIWQPATHLFHRTPSWRWLAERYGEPK